MQRNYNYVYSKLIEKDTDLIGHIAYSLYKKSKIEYIKKKKEEGTEPTDTDLIPFNDFSSSDSSIDSYKLKAEIILQGFVEYVLDEELKQANENAINQQSEILKQVVQPLIPKFRSNVLAGLLSGFIFALLLAAIAFIIQFSGSSISVNVDKKVIDKQQVNRVPS